MPAMDITNPFVINFLKESYEKTARLRMRWNEIHARNLKETATFRGPEKGYTQKDVAMKVISEGMMATTRDYIAAATHRISVPLRDGKFIPGVADMRKGHSIPEVGLGDPKDDPRLARPDTDMSPDSIMRPVPPKQKKIIYDGIPHFGRLEYLKVRNRIKPEDKYYFMESVGWVYGWRLKDSYFGRQAPMYGRHAKISKDAQCRSGPQPDLDTCSNFNMFG